MARAFYVATITCLITALTASRSLAAPFVIDDFDGGSDARLLSRTILPSNGSPQFPGSRFDVFGPTDRTVNFDFADDSAGSFPPDVFGIVPTGRTDMFFGVEDLDNGDNPGGGGTATWEFDISGLTDLSIQAVFSAMGDFEAGDNEHLFEVSIDGGAFASLFSILTDESIDPFTYMMEGGALVDLNDPLTLTDGSGTRVIDNSFTVLGLTDILGTGNLLTLRYTAGANNGGSEPFAFDDIILNGTIAPEQAVPEPASMAIFGVFAVGALGVAARRRKAAK